MTPAHPWYRLRVLPALVVVLALLLAACGSDDKSSSADGGGADEPSGASTSVDAPGVTDTQIKFAAFGTDSNNPLGTCVLQCFTDGVEAYFAYRNAQGGVHGRELVLDQQLDDELSKSKVRALELVAANDAFAIFGSTQGSADGWNEVAEANIPLFVWAIHPQAMQHDSIFGNQGVTCITCPTRHVPYVAKRLKAKKIAALGYGVSENSRLCAARVKESLELVADETGGAEAVYVNDDLAFGLPNGAGPEVSEMKRLGVDLVVGCIELNGMKSFAQEMERQGMGDVPMYHPNTYDQTFVTNGDGLFEGDVMGVTFRPFEAESNQSSLDEFKTWMKKTGSDISEVAMYGWIDADLAYKGIEAAGEDFDRQKVIDALNSMEDYTADGLIAPLDIGRQHLPPSRENPAEHGNIPDCSAFVQVKNGKFEPLDDPEKPFTCFPGDTAAWANPTFEDFG